MLNGLPPSVDDLHAFLNDSRPDAYERLVDRLLATPHFGENWARHWMDVVRYGDTYGYEWDIPAKGAWHYRDYLVRAFNSDVPFDQLVREQVAGDLIPAPRIDTNDGRNDSLIGLLFFQLGENRHGDSAEFDGIHQEMIHNKIDAFSKAFQALTIGCARCHDHKFDAVSQRDYYALAGVFQSSRSLTNTVDTPDRDAATIEELRRFKRELRPILADWWLNSSQHWAESLLAATKDSVWDKAVATAGAEPALEHPLRAWVASRKADREQRDIARIWTDLATTYANESKQRAAFNANTFQVVADFRQPVPSGWSIDGGGLRSGPVRAGEFIVTLEGEKAVDMLLPGGLFTNVVSPKLNGAVRSPYLDKLPERWLSIQSCGGDFAAERTVVDNAFLTERQAYLARRVPTWSTRAGGR